MTFRCLQFRRLSSFSGQPKRFYKEVSIIASNGSVWEIFLDQKPIKTPGRSDLHIPSEALAEAIAIEFESQKERIIPSTMPLMTIASTALDVTSVNMVNTVDRVASFLETDTVCFESNEEPELRDLQQRSWEPLRELVKQDFGISTLVTTSLSFPGGNCPIGVAALKRHLEGQSAFELTCMEIATSYAKSAVIALALLEGRRGLDVILDAALVEEQWQRKRWGTVEGAHDINEREMAMWLAACSFFKTSLIR